MDLDKKKIEINAKSIVKIDPTTGEFKSTIIVDSDDKLRLNYNSDFFVDYNNNLWVNLGPGLTRNDSNKISISLAGCQLHVVNDQLCLDSIWMQW